MTQILAINPASQEAVERMQIETMKREFEAFVRTDPEVRQLMLAKVAKTISELGSWEISFHGGFKEMIGEILKQPEVRPALEEAAHRVLQGADENLNYRIIEAVGEYLAGRITMKLPEENK